MKMGQQRWMLLALYFLFLTGHTSGQTMSVNQPSPKIKIEIFPSDNLGSSVVLPGTNVTITCSLLHDYAGNWPPVSLTKVVINQNNQPLTETIATSGDLTRFYKGIGRFSIAKNSEETTLIFILSIRGVTLEDSGNYACSVPGDNLYDIKPLSVLREPETLYFEDHNRVIIENSINMTEGMASHFSCRVPNVFPTPDVNIYVNRRKSQKLEEKTELFVITEELKVLCKENVGEKDKCPLHLSFNMLAENRDFKPTFEHDEQYISCWVRMREFSRPGNKTSIKMNVEYKPKITCLNDVTQVAINKTNVVIKCEIWSNPPVAWENKTWTVTPLKGQPVILDANHISDQYRVEEVLSGFDGKLSELHLIINKVSKADYSAKYHITATNEQGTEKKEVRVESDEKPNGAERSFTTSWMILTALVTVMFHFTAYRWSC